ncbi:MAG TPA: alpha/beta fold hydrolase, partial [Ktedonobacterales bacterium]
MSLDVELYRRTVYAPAGNAPGAVRRLSALDLAPDGADRAMVLIHGYGGRALQWIYQLRAFGQTMRVVAPDLRGHGQTDDPDAVPQTMDSLVADLELLLERLTVPRPFALVAHSFGGAVATEYALRHPEDVSQLVLIAVPTRFILRPGTRPMMSIPEPVFETVVKRLNIALYASPRTLRRMHDGAMSAWRGDQRMPELRVPTLVILGQRDTVFDQDYYAGVARAIPGAKQVVIPVSAHLVQLERAEATNRAIRRFIAAHPGESTPGAAPAPAARASLSARYAAMPWLQAYDPEVPETIPTPRGLLHELVSHAASDFPDRSALVYFGQRIGYRELDHLSNRFAHALRKLGVAKGDRVAIVLPNVPQCVIAFYGTLKAGAVVVLGSPLSTEEEIDAQVRDAGARVVLTLSAYRSLAARVAASAGVRQIIYSDVREYLPLAQRVALASLIAGAAPHANPARAAAANGASSAARLGALPAPLSSAGDDMGNGAGKPVTYAFQELLRSQPATPLDAGTTSDDLALLQYTSGTTGSARGVMLTHANLVVNTAQTRHWIPSMRRGKETLLCVLPLSHSYGLTSGLNLTVALAGTLVLLPTTRIEQILKAIKRYHPSLFPGIPALYLAIANYPHVRRYGVAAIRVCVSGSAPLPVE